MDDLDLVPISALQHYLYCPRQCALIHVEQLWAENRHTAEGKLLHERVDQQRTERRRGVRTVSAVPLINTTLGVRGIADVVEFHQQPDGDMARPVEYKRGRPKTHRADEVQLCAQALCLEEMQRTQVPSGDLYYGKTKRRREVVFDETLRALTLQTIVDVRGLFAAARTPTATYVAKRCDACSLIDLCQPRWLERSKVRSWLQSALGD